MTQRPYGAIDEDERLKLRQKYSNNEEANKGFFAVSNRSNELYVGSVTTLRKSFAFTWGPEEGFYFKNYWHAYTYHLRRKAEVIE
jgi:hypothetical protein